MLYKNKFLVLVVMLSLISVLWLFSGFIKAGVVAWLLVLVTQPLTLWIENFLAKSSWQKIVRAKLALSALVLTLIFVLLVVVPTVYLITYAISSFNYQAILAIKPHLLANLNSITWLESSTKLKLISWLSDYLADMGSGERLKQVWQFSSSYLQNISSGVFNLSLVIIFFFLFTLYRSQIIAFFSNLLPLPDAQKNTIANNVSGTLSVVFMTVFVVAVSQGIAFAGLMLFFDYNPLLLGFLQQLVRSCQFLVLH